MKKFLGFSLLAVIGAGVGLFAFLHRVRKWL